MEKPGRYTCMEYRQEMTLLGLKRRLENTDLADGEKEQMVIDIKVLEAEMGMD